MRILTAAIMAVGALIISAGAALAGPYDGDWIGQVPTIGQCAESTINLTIVNDTLMGQIHNPENVRGITGKIDADGNATFNVTATNFNGTMKFNADHFEGNWFNGGCNRHVLGDRAPDAVQTAAMVVHRKQQQVIYDTLTAKAAVGDRTVDFTALRAAYPFTAQWDVFGDKAIPLLNQAIAAQKGGDCTAALEKLDEVLKTDFTIITAHRTRSDCLDGAAARVENYIADKLEDSLTDTGNGNSEKDAYPVMTMQEENYILVRKHVILKGRQTEVRGSDGRFYDQVHALAARDGLEVRDIYFDVTAEVDGRNSRMAEARTLANALP